MERMLLFNPTVPKPSPACISSADAGIGSANTSHICEVQSGCEAWMDTLQLVFIAPPQIATDQWPCNHVVHRGA